MNSSINPNVNTIKKDLQKIVKKFRDAKPDVKNWCGETCREVTPKSSMTYAQMMKGTATVNFGSNNDKHLDELDAFTASDAFKTFCEKHGIKVGPKEINSDKCLQLRLYY